MKYFKSGEKVKLDDELIDGDFDVRIVNLVCNYYGDGKMYYVVEPVEFPGFRKEVLCERCYKEKRDKV